jgi:putative hydrolase of HD superfamily
MLLTLVELQRLKGLERTGWMLRGLPAGLESVAAHSYGVAVAAMLLGDTVQARGVAVNLELLLRLALMHDWAEARMGDLPRTASQYFGATARQHAEHAAFTDIVAGLGAEAASNYLALYESYEERKSLEARLVKVADVVDLLVQVLAFERAGARGLDEFWESAAQIDFRLSGVAHEVAQELFQALREARRQIVQF